MKRTVKRRGPSKRKPFDYDRYLQELELTTECLIPKVNKGEARVLGILVTGMRNREIAHVLGISFQTVKNHIYNMCHRFDLNDRTQLVVFALTGYIPNGKGNNLKKSVHRVRQCPHCRSWYSDKGVGKHGQGNITGNNGKGRR